MLRVRKKRERENNIPQGTAQQKMLARTSHKNEKLHSVFGSWELRF